MASTKYTHAIVSRVPDIFSKQANSCSTINLQLARNQHLALLTAIRGLGVDVLELPPDENSLDSVYTQDLAVIVNGIALMCRPGPHRQAEVDNVKAVLKKELHQTVVEPTSSKALLSGSDVLFTGREFFVGISQSTNTEGAVAVAATWPEYPCTPVKVDGPYHLKTFLNMAGPEVISVGAGPEAQNILKRMEREATHRYQTLTLPEDRAANCLFVNGTLIHKSKEEAPKSDHVFSAKIDFPRIPLPISEFSKTPSQRPLSSLIILLRKTKHVRRI